MNTISLLPCAVILAVVTGFAILFTRSRDVERRHGKLRQRLAKVQAEIEYLEARGIEKAGTLDTPLKDLHVARASLQEKLKIVEDARAQQGKAKLCSDGKCRHANLADAKHCARCGRLLA